MPTLNAISFESFTTTFITTLIPTTIDVESAANQKQLDPFSLVS